MKKLALSIALVTICLCSYSQIIEPNWESIKSRPYPQWFSDAKLGIFIHWGLYSVPAYCSKEGYSEWYYKGLMDKNPTRMEFHKRVFGEQFKYSDFNTLFKAELFNPEEWSDLFVKSGAKYVILVTKHHDGYCLWNSKYAPNWNSVTGGTKRDIVGDLTASVREHGLKMGFYYSLPEWNNPLHVWTVDPDDSISDYVDNHMIPQFKELVSLYKPSLVFTDGEWNNSAEQWHATELISWYYNTVGKEAIVNDRWGHGSDYGFRTPEYSSGITDNGRPWAECRGLGRSFGLNRNEPIDNYLSSEELIKHFVKLVAAGGGLTINVGPSADGKIPLIQQERLLDLGYWLKINGNAIYGASTFDKYYDYVDVKLTKIDSNIDFDWVRNSPAPTISYDYFTVSWDGFLLVPATDYYNFSVDADDNIDVSIDDNKIISYKQGGSDVSDKIYLEKDKLHRISIYYEEKDLQAKAKLFWSSSKIEKQIIHPDNFFVDDLKTNKGLTAVYRCQQPYVCYTKNNDDLYVICLDFPDENLTLKLKAPNHKVKVFFNDNNACLMWKYKRGKIIINTSSIKYSDVKSKGAWVFRLANYFAY